MNRFFILINLFFITINASVECVHEFVPQKEQVGFEKNIRYSIEHQTDPKRNLHFEKNLPKQNYEVDFKVLIISADEQEKNDPGLQAAKNFLQGIWIPYDVLVLTKNGKKLDHAKLELLNADGSGKYIGIITTEYNLSYKALVDGKTVHQSALSKEEWSLLFKYEKEFNVRHVSLYTYPDEYLGFKAIKPVDNFKKNSIKINADFTTEYFSGMNLSAEVGIKENWHYPVEILESEKKRIFPILNFTEDSNSVAGLWKKTQDGREEMHFFFSQTKNTLASKFVAPIWIKWLTRNIYLGKKRAYLTAQIDDYLTPTKIWNPLPHVKRLEYRTSVEDIREFIKFQNEYLKKETQDKNYKIEMAFNGKGTFLYGGEGVDPLSNFSVKNAHEFFWVSHTYSHPELNDITYKEMIAEISNNVDAAKYLLRDNYHLFSEFGFVTPRISGLYNKEALSALYDSKISYVIGDNTKTDYRHPLNKHLPRATTLELNGFVGSHIIPRFPNDIFYNVSLLPELEGLFNHYYELSGEKSFNYERILLKNALEATGHLLEHDYSPYMFHQANMRLFDFNGSKESLLSLWFRSVLSEYRKLSTLPLKSLSFNELIAVYNERRDYEECKLKAKFKISNLKLSEIKVSSENSCQFPITGIEALDLSSTELSKSEQYGDESTLYFEQKKSTQNQIIDLKDLPYIVP